jgi:glycolate oxidase FAD binding subunit
MDTFAPASEADAAAIVADAYDRKRMLAVEGLGSKRAMGRLCEPSGVLKLALLDGIVAYEPDELVITARAGMKLSDIEASLAEKNQCLAFEPSNWSLDPTAEATIGGTVAAGVAGARRVVMGGARDHLIGFRAINGTGSIFKAGGRVVKNVTGYDLPKLAAGSFGTLFALTEVTLRCYPRTAVPTSVVITDLSVEQGCRLLRKAVASPWEATGFCYLPRAALDRLDMEGERPESLTAIRFEGSSHSMAARAQGFLQALAPEGKILSDACLPLLWSEIAQLKPFRRANILWRVSVPPAVAPHALKLFRPDCFAVDWAGGLLWIEHNEPSLTANEVQAIARDLEGHAMLFHGPDEMRRTSAIFAPLDEATTALMQRLKQAFDPGGVFNPGRMYAGI